MTSGKISEKSNKQILSKAETCQFYTQEHLKRSSLGIIYVFVENQKKSILFPLKCLSLHVLSEESLYF